MIQLYFFCNLKVQRWHGTAEADLLEQAIAGMLDQGLRTADIKSKGTTVVSTAEMGERLAK
jgi:isocitrate/isopropylmalate dehydrogenase